jgi:hypothetical protein
MSERLDGVSGRRLIGFEHRDLRPRAVRVVILHQLGGDGLDDVVDVHWVALCVRPQTDVDLLGGEKVVDYKTQPDGGAPLPTGTGSVRPELATACGGRVGATAEPGQAH